MNDLQPVSTASFDNCRFIYKHDYLTNNAMAFIKSYNQRVTDFKDSVTKAQFPPAMRVSKSEVSKP